MINLIKIVKVLILISFVHQALAQTPFDCNCFDQTYNLQNTCDTSVVNNNAILNVDSNGSIILNANSSNYHQSNFYLGENESFDLSRDLINDIFLYNPLDPCTSNCSQIVVYSNLDSLIAYVSDVNSVNNYLDISLNNDPFIQSFLEDDNISSIYILQSLTDSCVLYQIDLQWKGIAFFDEFGNEYPNLLNVCDDDDLTINVAVDGIDPYAPYQYIWNFNGQNCNTPSCTFSVDYFSNNQQVVSFNIAGPNGEICGSKKLYLDVMDFSVANIFVSEEDPTCYGEDVFLELSNFPTDSNFTYVNNWFSANNPNYFTNGNTFQINADGVYCNQFYIEELADSANNCYTSNCVNYQYFPLVNASTNLDIYIDGSQIAASGNYNICTNEVDSFVITVNDDLAIDSFVWLIDGVNVGNDLNELVFEILEEQSDSNLMIELLLTDTNGCNYTNTFNYFLSEFNSVEIGSSTATLASNNNLLHCIGDELIIDLDNANQFDSFSWEIQDPFGSVLQTINDTTTASLNYDLLASTLFIITANDGGCLSYDSVFVELTDLPLIAFNVDGNNYINDNDLTIPACLGDSITIIANSQNPFDSLINYDWINQYVLSDTLAINTANLDTGLHYFEIWFQDGISNCVNFDSIKIYVNPLPESTYTQVNSEGICIGSQIDLSADGLDPSLDYEWLMEDSLFNNAGEVSFTVPDTTEFTIDLIVQDPTTGCIGTSQTTYTVYNADELLFINTEGDLLGDSITICPGEDSLLAVLGTFDSFTWASEDGSVISTGTSSNASDGYNGNCYVTVRDENACETTNSIFINSIPEPYLIQVYPDDGTALSGGFSTILNTNSIAIYRGSQEVLDWELTGDSNKMSRISCDGDLSDYYVIIEWNESGSIYADFEDNECGEQDDMVFVNVFGTGLFGEIEEMGESRTLIFNDELSENAIASYQSIHSHKTMIDYNKFITQLETANFLADYNLDDPFISYYWFELKCAPVAIYNEMNYESYQNEEVFERYLGELQSDNFSAELNGLIPWLKTTYFALYPDSLDALIISGVKDTLIATILADRQLYPDTRILECNSESSLVDGNTFGHDCNNYDLTTNSVFGVEVIIRDLTDTLKRNIFFYDPNQNIVETRRSEVTLQNLSADNISLFPTINNGDFMVKIKNFESNVEMKIVDITGKVLHNQNLESATSSINLKQFATGNYIAVFTSENKTVANKKFIISN